MSQILDREGSLKLGGQKKELTVLFSDLREFTAYSESVPPEEVVGTLNLYHSELSKIILESNGTIDKYIGDSIMCIFGAPLEYEDHADRACNVALDMAKKNELLARQRVENGLTPFRMGISINTGDMIVGNVGSTERIEYTVVGDSVNLAARMDSLTKIFGCKILVSEFTASQTTKNAFIFRDMGLVLIKGKQQRVRFFELLGRRADENEFQEWLPIWNKALAEIASKNFAGAHKLLEAFIKVKPEDKNGKLFLQRCERAISEPENFDFTLKMIGK